MSEMVSKRVKIAGCVLITALIIGLTIFIFKGYDNYAGVDKKGRFEIGDERSGDPDSMSRWGTLI